MIVCLCKGVSDRTLRAARDAGATTLQAVSAATGAGTGCGCCHGTIARILAEPCREVPCAACPHRAPEPVAAAPGPSEGVPVRAAASGNTTP